MKQKIAAILMVLVMLTSLAACNKGEDTTLTGMVVSVDGTVISLVQMDGEMGNMNPGSGEMPQMPGGMGGFGGFGDFNPEDFGDFNPEDFEGMFLGGGDFSQWGEGEMPEMPEGMEIPEDMTMPSFSGGDFDFDSIVSDAETKEVDIGDAHISVEIDGGKASGSISDIQAGVFVTITMNAKGEVTNVLVSSRSSYGG